MLPSAQLRQQRFVLQDAVIVDAHGNEVQLRLVGELDQRVEEAHFGRAQRAVARQSSFGKDPLRDPAPGDQLQVPAQHRVVQRIGKSTADEEAPERPEQGVERKHPGPLAHRVADRHPARERPADDDVVEVAAVVDEEDGSGVVRQRWGRSHDHRPVDGTDGGPREPHAELEVGRERERRDDLVDVLLDALPHIRRPLAGIGGRFHRSQDGAVVEQLLAHELLAAELEQVHPDPVLLGVAARLAPLRLLHPPQDAVAQELVERQSDRDRDQDA